VTANGVTWAGNGTDVVLVPGTDGVFAPPYPYSLEPAASVESSVMAGAGAGAGTFAP